MDKLIDVHSAILSFLSVYLATADIQEVADSEKFNGESLFTLIVLRVLQKCTRRFPVYL